MLSFFSRISAIVHTVRLMLGLVAVLGVRSLWKVFAWVNNKVNEESIYSKWEKDKCVKYKPMVSFISLLVRFMLSLVAVVDCSFPTEGLRMKYYPKLQK